MRAEKRVLCVLSLSLALLLWLGVSVLAQEGDIENGKALFGEYCAVCHGYDGQGRVGASLEGWFSSIDPEAFVRATVSDGAGATMPAFARSNGGPLTEQEIDDIAAYILSWQERVEPAPTPTRVPVTPIPKVAGVTGDPTIGAQVFAQECQLCHGEKGQGGVGASLSSALASAQPAAFIRQVVNDGVDSSPMPAFRGVLSADDVENTVAFILSWEHQPAPRSAPAAEEEDGLNWLVVLIFLAVILVIVIWLITRFSRRKTPT
jgi:mono/diheme cytochrome c family protein